MMSVMIMNPSVKVKSWGNFTYISPMKEVATQMKLEDVKYDKKKKRKKGKKKKKLPPKKFLTKATTDLKKTNSEMNQEEAKTEKIKVQLKAAVSDTKSVFDIEFPRKDPEAIGNMGIDPVCIWRDDRYGKVLDEMEPFQPMKQPKAPPAGFNYFEASYRVTFISNFIEKPTNVG